MQSHEDCQHELGCDGIFSTSPETIADTLTAEQLQAFEALKVKAAEIMEKEGSQITAGKVGEESVVEAQVEEVFLRRMLDDPLCLRISIGAAHLLTDSTYCVFRGDPTPVILLLRKALKAMETRFWKEEW